MNMEMKKTLASVQKSDPVRGELFSALADMIDGAPGSEKRVQAASAALEQRMGKSASSLMAGMNAIRPRG